jgi:hypothetical protein
MATFVSYLDSAYQIARVSDDPDAVRQLVTAVAEDVVEQFILYERSFLDSLTNNDEKLVAIGRAMSSVDVILDAFKRRQVDTPYQKEAILGYLIRNVDPSIVETETGVLEEEVKAVPPETATREQGNPQARMAEREAKALVIKKVLEEKKPLAGVIQDLRRVGISASDTIVYYNKNALYKLAQRATKEGKKDLDEFIEFARGYGVDTINVLSYVLKYDFPVPEEKERSGGAEESRGTKRKMKEEREDYD